LYNIVENHSEKELTILEDNSKPKENQYNCIGTNIKVSPMFFNELLCKTMKIKFKNSPKIEFSFSENEIWHA